MARKYTKVEHLISIIEERAKAGETYREIGARPRNLIKFYDRLSFSCLLIGEQSILIRSVGSFFFR